MPTLPKTSATRQFAGCVLARVLPEKLETLRSLLAQIGRETTEAMRGAPVTKALVPLHLVGTIHYARFVLVDAKAGRKTDAKSDTMLAFSTNYDGPEGEDR